MTSSPRCGILVPKGNEHDAMVLRFGARDDNLTDAVVDFVTGPDSPSQ